MKGLFVTGTDTGVGKTVVAAWLMRALDGDYWKPVQAGQGGESDSDAVRRLTGYHETRFHESVYWLTAPLSPHLAAEMDGVAIDLDRFRLPVSERTLIVEGAGGVLVPLNDRAFMTDLIVRLRLPVVVVARTGLGTINHTLLTLEALRARRLALAGVVMNGAPDAANRRAIESFGKTRVIAELPPLEPLDAESLAAAATRIAPALSGAVTGPGP